MSKIYTIIDNLTDDELDLLQSMLERRSMEKAEEDAELYEEMEAEIEAKKHCPKCKVYLTCRERKFLRCSHCGSHLDWG